LAATLSFFIPGLGQIYAGRFVRGLLLAIPQTALLSILAWLYLSDRYRSGGLLLVNAMAFAMLNGALLIYRAGAVVDAYVVAGGGRRTGASRRGLASGAIALALLLVADVAIHGYAAYAAYVLDRSVDTSFPDDCQRLDPDAPRPRTCPRTLVRGTATLVPGPTLAPGLTATPTIGLGRDRSPAAPPVPTAPPVGTPYWAENGRLDVLLLGADKGVTRSGLRTDTMIVASVEISTGRSALFGIPRDVVNAPLAAGLSSSWSCRCFPPMLNGLISNFRIGLVRFTDGDDDPFRALVEIIEKSLRIELDGIVMVDLAGFVRVVDALGGIDIDVREAVYEREARDEYGQKQTIDIRAGLQHMDGHTALAYVRSRRQDSDYGRMGRQQDLLRAVRARFTACNVLPRLPALFEAIGDAVRTDIPREEVPALIELISRSKEPRRFELHPGRGYPSDWGDPATLAKVRSAVEQGFEPTLRDDVNAEPDGSLPPLPAHPC
jgi:LCP family protein required for cell wall assembly